MPAGVVISGAGNLYIADTTNSCIRMVEFRSRHAFLGGWLRPLRTSLVMVMPLVAVPSWLLDFRCIVAPMMKKNKCSKKSVKN